MTVDLTHIITENISLFPDTPAPKLEQLATIEKDSFNEKIITLASHVGTHIDAPNHILHDTPTLDKFPIDKFFGKAIVIDCSDTYRITTDKIILHTFAPKAEFILFYTGWEQKWNTEDYLYNFPVLTKQAAHLLTTLPLLKGIGLDTISVDPVNSTDLTIHKILLSRNLIIIENLTNLSSLPKKQIFDFFALPLKIVDADGAPVRAIAIL